MVLLSYLNNASAFIPICSLFVFVCGGMAKKTNRRRPQSCGYIWFARGGNAQVYGYLLCVRETKIQGHTTTHTHTQALLSENSVSVPGLEQDWVMALKTNIKDRT